MSQTSTEVYNQIVAEGLVSKLQTLVVRCLANASEPMTMGEIARAAGVSQRNTLDPRGPELCKLGVIEAVGKRECKTNGRTVNTYALTGRLPRSYPKSEGKNAMIARLQKENEYFKALIAKQDKQLATYRQVRASHQPSQEELELNNSDA